MLSVVYAEGCNQVNYAMSWPQTQYNYTQYKNIQYYTTQHKYTEYNDTAKRYSA